MYEKFKHVKTPGQLIFTGGVAEKFIHVKTQLKYVKQIHIYKMQIKDMLGYVRI